MTAPNDPAALARFRAAVLADEALQLDLVAFHDPAPFIACVVARAAGLGIALDPATLDPQMRRDPLDPYCFQERPVPVDAWLPRHWLPTEILDIDGALHVGWLHFAAAPLIDPFFEGSMRQVRFRPFNRLFRFATPLDVFVSCAEPAVQVDGLIFHMSRCGSTLVAQMLAALPDHIVVSEAPVLDTLIRRVASGTAPASAIGAMMAALTRDRTGGCRRRFIKLDSWHICALPMLRRVLPDVPWVFLYRDPVEVLVSHQRMSGIQTLPGGIPIAMFGIDGAASVPHADYCAWLLARLCAAALVELAHGNGQLADYRDLPDAVFASILPHFRFQPDAGEQALMAAAGLRDAKAPKHSFAPDGAAKRAEATDEVRERADRLMSAVYGQLESTRLGIADRRP